MPGSKIDNWTVLGTVDQEVKRILGNAVRKAEQILDAQTPQRTLVLDSIRVDYAYDPSDREPATTLANLIAATALAADPGVARYPLGARVLVPRSGGKPPSEGRVLEHRADGKIRVSFNTSDGRAAHKDLAPSILDSLDRKSAPAPATPSIQVLYPIGSKLRIPRRDGSTSEGVVVAHANQRVHVSFDAGGGQTGTKQMRPEDLDAVNPGVWIQHQLPPGFERVVGGQKLVQDLVIPSSAGGPAVQIDYHHPKVMQFVAHARMLAARQSTPAEKVAAVQSYTRRDLGGTEDQWRSFERGKADAKAISLGDYMAVGLGVCKQNSLALQIGLQELGIESTYVRGYVEMPDGKRGGHAWVEARIGGRLYLLDNLWKDWNFKLASEVYDTNWKGPRGYRPIRQGSHDAVSYKPVTPRARPSVGVEEAYPVGCKVLVPRSSGPPTPGKVTAHLGSDQVRVDFPEGHKVIPRSALDKVNPLDVSLPDDLPPELAR